MSRQKFFLAAVILALAAAIASPVPAQRTGVTITTFANLPATCTPDQPFVVSDSNATCTAGGGSSRWCLCDDAGTGYEADPGGTPGVDSVGTSQLDDGADTPLAGEWVQVDPGDTTAFLYKTDAELITESGAAPLASPALTGDPTAPTPSVDDNDTSVATTAFVQAETLGGDVTGTLSTVQVDDVQTATTNLETTGNNTTQVASTSFVQQEILVAEKAWDNWDAFEILVDGTKCKSPIGKTINSGPLVGSIDCDDDAASALYGSTLLEEYGGGTIVLTLNAISVNATPTGILDFDFSAQCRGDGDLVNGTWGTVQNASITFATQYDEEHADTAALTPDGTCAAGDKLYWRAVMDDTATTEVVADVEIIGVSMLEQ